jgi:hypothetical protein
VAFSYKGKDVSMALGQAIENKASREETPIAFGYTGGTVERFAGDRMLRKKGLAGDFGSSTQDPEGKLQVGDWAKLWAAGPLGPDSGV